MQNEHNEEKEVWLENMLNRLCQKEILEKGMFVEKWIFSILKSSLHKIKEFCPTQIKRAVLLF